MNDTKPKRKRVQLVPACDWTCACRLKAVQKFAQDYAMGVRSGHGGSNTTLYRVARRMGLIPDEVVESRKGGAVDRIDRDRLKALHERGLSAERVAKRMRIHPMSVYRIIAELGLTPHRRGRPWKPLRKRKPKPETIDA